MAELMKYLVVKDASGWQIDFHGKKFGPYPTEAEAISAATEAAYDMGLRGGHDAQVLVQGEDSQLHIKWRYGDPYTPPD
jgi:hypothetical protein